MLSHKKPLGTPCQASLSLVCKRLKCCSLVEELFTWQLLKNLSPDKVKYLYHPTVCSCMQKDAALQLPAWQRLAAMQPLWQPLWQALTEAQRLAAVSVSLASLKEATQAADAQTAATAGESHGYNDAACSLC